jgi:hypothetical protein
VSQWLDLEVNAPDELYNLGGFTLRVSLLDARGYELTTDTKVRVPAGTPLASATKMQRVLMIHAKALCDTENRYTIENTQKEIPNPNTGYTGIFYYQRDNFDPDTRIRYMLYNDGWRAYPLGLGHTLPGTLNNLPPNESLHRNNWKTYLTLKEK